MLIDPLANVSACKASPLSNTSAGVHLSTRLKSERNYAPLFTYPDALLEPRGV